MSRRASSGPRSRGRSWVLRDRRRRRDERGAVALLIGLLLPALLFAGAFVMDIGLQRVGRGDMQSLADVVALDLSRELDGRTAAQLAPVIDAQATKSLERNLDVVGDERPTIGVELGRLSSTGTFSTVSGGTRVTAVRVTATLRVDYAFSGVTGSDHGTTSRQSIGAATSFACYRLGSWAASLNTGDSVLLDPVLQQMAMESGAFSNGGAVKAISYTGLANATVNLGDLAANMGIATVDELATSSVSLRKLYAGITALAQPRNQTTISALNTLATTASSSATVDMSKILAVDSGSVSLLDATANVLDLVGGSISVIDQTQTAYIYLGATLPSVSSANFKVSLIDGPRQYCGGPSEVPLKTAQITAQVGGQLNPVTIGGFNPIVSGLLNNITKAEITAQNYATFDLTAAYAQSKLSTITCGSTNGVSLAVENGLATVTFETDLRGEIRGDLLNLGLLGLPAVLSSKIAIDAHVKVVISVSPSGSTNISISVPPRAYDTPYPTGSGGLTLAPAEIRSGFNVTANQVLLGGVIGGNISLNVSQKNQIITSFINAGLASLFSPTDSRSLANTVIAPMLRLAGLSVGGSDVILDSKPALSCTHPRLVG